MSIHNQQAISLPSQLPSLSIKVLLYPFSPNFASHIAFCTATETRTCININTINSGEHLRSIEGIWQVIFPSDLLAREDDSRRIDSPICTNDGNEGCCLPIFIPKCNLLSNSPGSNVPSFPSTLVQEA